MKKSILILLLCLVVLSATACDLVKLPDYYELNDKDKIISFTNVVGERALDANKEDLAHGVQRVAYTYKEVENAYADCEKYINFLMDEEGFKSLDFIKLDQGADEITLRKPSALDGDYEIRIVVEYNSFSKTVDVTAEREKVAS